MESTKRTLGHLSRFRRVIAGADAERAKAQVHLERIGVIDVGSNSVRLVVFDGMARSPAYFYNEKVLCGLGAGLSETGRLSPGGWIRAMATLERFAALAERMRINTVICVATAAVREAKDGRDFCDQVKERTGLTLHIASGVEEATLAAQGVLLGWPDAAGLVCDMGGASMELAAVAGGKVADCETSRLGPLALAELTDPETRDKQIRKLVKALVKSVPASAGTLYLVGGSWRAIARLDMERMRYPLKVLHGYAPPVAQLAETLDWIASQDAEEMSAMTGTSTARLSLVPLASLVLAELLRRAAPDRIVISASGLREGLLYREMPEAMRRLDPLLETCEHMEAASARAPGFGMALADWLGPLYAGQPAEELRLVRAACLLHDVNWRAHPDYRAELCFESVTRANVGGIDHADRIFLGTALLNRYKSARPSGEAGDYGDLLDPARFMQAVVLGRAMRLGAMLSGSATGVLEHTELTRSEDRVRLVLHAPARPFAGEVVERRLASLAAKLDSSAELIIE